MDAGAEDETPSSSPVSARTSEGRKNSSNEGGSSANGEHEAPPTDGASEGDGRAGELLRPMPIRTGIVTISETATEESDRLGNLLVRLLSEENYDKLLRKVVPSKKGVLEKGVIELAGRLDAVFILGAQKSKFGTSAPDVIGTFRTHEDIRLFGVEEAVRAIGRRKEESGSAFWRVGAMVKESTFFFCLPQKREVVKPFLEEIIFPNLEGLVEELRAENIKEAQAAKEKREKQAGQSSAGA